MFDSNEVQKNGGQIQFSPAVLNIRRLQLPPASNTKKNAFRIRTAGVVRSVNLSGAQILVGSVSALGSMGLFVWALVKLWLFGH
jgi:hypothetical protein